MTHKFQTLAVALVWTGTILLLGASVNCNTTARVRFEENQLSGLAISNAQTKTANSDLASCDLTGGDSARLILSTVLFGTRGDDSSSEIVALRPGDKVSRSTVTEGSTVATTHFTFNKLCIQEDTQGMCNEAEIANQQITVQTNKVEYFPRMGASDNLGLVILLDQSGSVSGALQAKGTDFIETDDALADVNVASDPQSVRTIAIQSLIEKLGSNDKVLVIAFNSKGLRLVCNLSEADFPDFNDRATKCFSANKSPLTDPELSKQTLGSTEIQFNAKGRSNMWQAVKFAIEFHNKNSAGLKPQILVVNDGPDTCTNYEGFENCSTTTFQNVEQIVLGQSPFPINFVQFTSRVHKNRDAQQQRIACLTNGEYMFVTNVNGLKDNGPIKGALTLQRFMLFGTWRVHVDIPALGSRPNGKGYLIQGIVNFDSTDLGQSQQFLLRFDPDTTDSRLHVLK